MMQNVAKICCFVQTLVTRGDAPAADVNSRLFVSILAFIIAVRECSIDLLIQQVYSPAMYFR